MALDGRLFVVAYDATCGPCSAFKRAVGALDASRRLWFVPLEVADRSGMLDAVEEYSRYASFHLLRLGRADARAAQVWSGADALLPLARLLSPAGMLAAWLVERMPGGTLATAFAYSKLSSLHRGCPTGRGRPSSG